MRDFDEERRQREEGDREFVIAGQKFRLRAAVKAEVMEAWEDLPVDASSKETYEAIDDFIRAWLDPSDEGAQERWTFVREQDDDPVTTRDMWAVFRFCLAQNTGFPTEAPVSSTAGPEASAPTSQPVSPPKVVGTIR